MGAADGLRRLPARLCAGAHRRVRAGRVLALRQAHGGGDHGDRSRARRGGGLEGEEEDDGAEELAAELPAPRGPGQERGRGDQEQVLARQLRLRVYDERRYDTEAVAPYRRRLTRCIENEDRHRDSLLTT